MGTLKIDGDFHPFHPGEDLLVIEIVDPGDAGDALEIELVLTPFVHSGGIGTVVGYRAVGPGLDPAEIRTLTRCVGITPEEWSETDVVIERLDQPPAVGDWLWRFTALPSRLNPPAP